MLFSLIKTIRVMDCSWLWFLQSLNAQYIRQLLSLLVINLWIKIIIHIFDTKITFVKIHNIKIGCVIVSYEYWVVGNHLDAFSFFIVPFWGGRLWILFLCFLFGILPCILLLTWHIRNIILAYWCLIKL